MNKVIKDSGNDLPNRAGIDWDKVNGLLPVVIQHALTGAVLMQAYMSPESWQQTLDSGRVCFYSRSRQRLWTKGETSGHVLHLTDWAVDCDGDCLLLQVMPDGPTCHRGTVSCFDDPEAAGPVPSGGFLNQLQNTIQQRAADTRASRSYTRQLLEAGLPRMAQKVGEEGVETALAAVTGSDAELLGEAADLLYHLLVLLQGRGLKLEQVLAVLSERHRAAHGEPGQR